MKITKFIISLIIIMVQGTALWAGQVNLDRGVELFKLGRWIDARHEFMKAKELISKRDDLAQQRLDCYLALAAAKLDDRAAEAILLDFESRYPQSIYNNKIRLAHAMLCTADGDYDKARECFEQVDYKSLTVSEQERMNIRLGYIYFADKEYDASREVLNRIDPQSEFYDHARYYISYIDYINGDRTAALDGFGSLTDSDIYGALVPYYILQVEFQEGNYQYVIEKGAELMEQTSQNWQMELARTIAESCFQVGDYNKAIEQLDLFQRRGGEVGREESYILGFSLYRTARYDEAIRELKLVVGPEDAMTQNASYHLADCYLKIGDKRGAMQAFALASNEDFSDTIAEDALFNYGKLLYELSGSGFDATINVLTRYINTYPDTKRAEEAKTILISAYYNSHHYDAAYKAIKEIKRPDADILAALQKIAYFRGIEAYKAGDIQLANSCLEESAAVGISPKYCALAKFWSGEIAFGREDYELAMENYKAYLSLAPKSDPTYKIAQYSSGYTYLKQSELDAALDCFKRYLDLESGSSPLKSDAYNRSGDIYYGKRQFAAASRSYSAAAKAGGEGSDYARYQIAIIYGIEDRQQEKIAALKSLLAEDSGEYMDDAAFELGRTYMTQGEYDMAAKSYGNFILDYPSSPKYAQALSALGLSYLNMGDDKSAVEYYDKAIAAAPQSAIAKDAMQGIREIYIGKGNANGYFEYAEKRGMEGDLNLVARDSLTFASAQQLFLAGGDDVAAAAAALGGYLSDYKNGYYTTDALFLISDCYLKLGETDKAIESLMSLSQRGTNQYSERVLDRLSQLTFSEGMYRDAADAYRKLYDVAKGESLRARAMGGYAKSAVLSKDKALVMRMSEDVLSKDDAGEEATLEARYAKATICRERGERSEAVELYKIIAADPNSRRGAEANYYIIESVYRSGDKDEAERLIFEFAETKTPQAYWLAKAFLLLGDIYLDREDSFQALATYQSIVDGYSVEDDGVLDEAKSKIEKLQ